ncbi:MAG: acylneuraminate cytidylyltransferase family protein [Pseudohongiella nitratireducens]|nr:acylneuraminate cytidylyltransferase family protein [Pseudohongiella nitratireducens]MDF1622646.1 acylneuraminate cytidylyltransferase family protein [Pseudohongiella nitratireducens]
MKKVFAFVFARGGSKGLPRKNVLPLGGIPLVAHSIMVAKQIIEIERIFVSTDDDEIKRIATAYGAEVINRPKELSSDNASELEAWRHALNYLKDKGEDFDIFLSLPATSPLRDQSDVIECLASLDDETDIVLTVTPASRSPFFNMVSRGFDGRSRLLLPSSGYVRRQDVPQAYDITTVAYAVKPKFIHDCNSLFDGSVKSVVVPKERAIDIDDGFDYKFAEVLYKKRG